MPLREWVKHYWSRPGRGGSSEGERGADRLGTTVAEGEKSTDGNSDTRRVENKDTSPVMAQNPSLPGSPLLRPRSDVIPSISSSLTKPPPLVRLIGNLPGLKCVGLLFDTDFCGPAAVARPQARWCVIR